MEVINLFESRSVKYFESLILYRPKPDQTFEDEFHAFVCTYKVIIQKGSAEVMQRHTIIIHSVNIFCYGLSRHVHIFW